MKSLRRSLDEWSELAIAAMTDPRNTPDVAYVNALYAARYGRNLLRRHVRQEQERAA